jgi:hypothetical protein
VHFDHDPGLHRRAKVRAAKEGISLKDWIARAIEQVATTEEASDGQREHVRGREGERDRR